MIAAAAAAIADHLAGLPVPVHRTPVPVPAVTGRCVFVGGPSLAAETGITGCGYVQATVPVTAVAAGLDSSHVEDLYSLVDTIIAAFPPNQVMIVAVAPTVWGDADQPIRPAYEITTVTVQEA